MSKYPFFSKKKMFEEEKKSCWKKERKKCYPLSFNIRTTRFKQSSPVQPVSESMGGTLSLKEKEEGWKHERTNELFYKHPCLGLSVNWIITITRRYGPLGGPTFSSCRGLWPTADGFFCPLGKKNRFWCCFDQFKAV